jgi:hypothetical protein
MVDLREEDYVQLLQQHACDWRFPWRSEAHLLSSLHCVSEHWRLSLEVLEMFLQREAHLPHRHGHFENVVVYQYR